MATIDNVMVGFCAVIHFPHPKVKNIKRVHRVVVHPDYQGLGIGSIMMSYLAEKYIEQGYRFTIVTSNLSLLHSFKKDDHWHLYDLGRKVGKHAGIKSLNRTNSSKRFTMSWEYRRITS